MTPEQKELFKKLDNAEYPLFFADVNKEEKKGVYVCIPDREKVQVITISLPESGDHSYGHYDQRKGEMNDADWDWFVMKHTWGIYNPVSAKIWQAAKDRLKELIEKI